MVFSYLAHNSNGLEAATAADVRQQKARSAWLLAAGFAKKTVCETRSASKRV